MKLIFDKEEVAQFVKEKVADLSPEGKVPNVKISDYSSEWCTVDFVDAPATTATDAADKTEPELPPEDKPIDLSEIPF